LIELRKKKKLTRIQRNHRHFGGWKLKAFQVNKLSQRLSIDSVVRLGEVFFFFMTEFVCGIFQAIQICSGVSLVADNPNADMRDKKKKE
jgi:hypothetical protein